MGLTNHKCLIPVDKTTRDILKAIKRNSKEYITYDKIIRDALQGR